MDNKLPRERPATQREVAEINQLSDGLQDLIRGHDMKMVMYVLSNALPLYWCSNKQFTTVTEALDLWRELNIDMETTIRRAFGYIRYGK